MNRANPIVLSRWLGPLLMLPALSGCVAAVAVPVLTATGALTERNRSRDDAPPSEPEPGPALAAIAPPVSDGAAAAPAVALTQLAELPPPSGSVAARDPWTEFVAFALEQYDARARGEPVRSMLLEPESAVRLEPEHTPCTQREAAVLLDLDKPDSLFAPDDQTRAAPGLAQGLARLRAAGVVVLWISQLDANRVNDVARRLKESGLDPTGRDPILLARSPGDRKQVIREQANETVCVIAMAGDERGDFDELFEYLRNPDSAFRFDALMGAGWFLVPSPLAEAGAASAL